jgi:hypothetical protein
MTYGHEQGYAGRLGGRAQTGLYLCPCDITPRTFKKFEDGTVAALDFGATCFLPPVFFAVAVRKLVGNFARRVAQRVHYPVLSGVRAIVATSYFLVPFGRNDIGQVRSLFILHRLTSRLNSRVAKSPLE